MDKRNDKLHWIFVECARYVEEVLTDTRKGVPQSYYVVEVKEDQEYFDYKDTNTFKKVPKELVGLWRQEWSGDNTWDGYEVRVKDDSFVRCEKVEVTTYEYKKI